MARRSILDEGDQEANETEASSTKSDSGETTKSTQNEDESGRLQTTVRLPTDLADDLDDWANLRGMSRNAAITYFIAEGLSD